MSGVDGSPGGRGEDTSDLERSPSISSLRDGQPRRYMGVAITPSRKKWIALGLTTFLVILLLVAVVILSLQPNAQLSEEDRAALDRLESGSVPKCDNISDTVASNAALNQEDAEKKPEPNVEESKIEGHYVKPSTTTTTTTTTTTSTTTSTPSTTTTTTTTTTSTTTESEIVSDDEEEEKKPTDLIGFLDNYDNYDDYAYSYNTEGFKVDDGVHEKGSKVDDGALEKTTTTQAPTIDRENVLKMLALNSDLSDENLSQELVKRLKDPQTVRDTLRSLLANSPAIQTMVQNNATELSQMIDDLQEALEEKQQENALPLTKDLHHPNDGHSHPPDYFDQSKKSEPVIELLKDLKRSLEENNLDAQDLTIAAKMNGQTDETFAEPLDAGEPRNGTETDNKAVLDKLRRLIEVIHKIDNLVGLDEQGNFTMDGDYIEYHPEHVEALKDLFGTKDIKLVEAMNREIDAMDENIDDVMEGLSMFNSSVIDTIYRMFDELVQKEENFSYGQLFDEMAKTGMSNAGDFDSDDSKLKQFKEKRVNESAFDQVSSEISGRLLGDEIECDPETELMCDNGLRCYKRTQRCDRWKECIDFSDEVNCTCRDYIPANWRCDGYPDCPNAEDETECGCVKGTFSCGLDKDSYRPICMDNSLRCDNVVDCPDSFNDEEKCFALDTEVMSPDAFSRSQADGMLHIHAGGQWQVMGFHVDSDQERENVSRYLDSIAALICPEFLPDTMDKPYVQLLENVNGMFGSLAHITLHYGAYEQRTMESSVGRYSFEIAPPHNGTVVASIFCGQPICGTSASINPFSMLVTEQRVEEENYNYDDEDDLSVKIVGGDDASPVKWPFAAALMKNGITVCGATIVSEEWIMTAAHCVKDFQNKTKNNLYQVLAGTHRKSSSAPSLTFRTLVEIHMHNGYDNTWLLNDIALARVDQPFHLNVFTAPACLPDEKLEKNDERLDDNTYPAPGDYCMAVGWGTLSESGPSADTLQEVVIPVLDSCKATYNNITTQICGGYKEGGKDSCQGDSGGPLFCQSDVDGSWYLAGVISHGIGCAKPDSPGVYTRVLYFRDWIDNIMKGVSGKDAAGSWANSQCDTLTCDGGRCMPKALVCDSYVHCLDGADEKYCQYKVENGKVVGTPVLPAYSHPVQTPSYSQPLTYNDPYKSVHQIKHISKHCEGGFFRCENVHQCIPMSKKCDMKADCVDGTDEYGCKCRDYLQIHNPARICDAYPDCHDWGDEVGCQFCSNYDSFYCDLSKKCISKDKVCDKNNDCQYREDERYCFSLVQSDALELRKDGRPEILTNGYVAYNANGKWKVVCTEGWEQYINDRICRYITRKRGESYELVDQSVNPYLAYATLKVRQPEHEIYPRSLDYHRRSGIVKRQLGEYNGGSCKYVDTTCSLDSNCGVMHLYNFMAKETPSYGPGVFPWMINLYKEGEYICAATLVHRSWFVTSQQCATKFSLPDDYVVARMGGYRDEKFLSAHEQTRRVVLVTRIPGSSIFLGTFNAPADMNEHVNNICIPSLTWIPKEKTCFFTGRYDNVLNHAIETKVDGPCNVVGDNFDICTTQHVQTGECIENWSGALACPDATGKFYAVGVFYSGPNNCNSDGQQTRSLPNNFSSIVSEGVRDAIGQIILTADDGPNSQAHLSDTQCTGPGKHRCPLGRCLNSTQICDGTPHCKDASDEEPYLCKDTIRMCEHVDATHCQCLLNDMMCDNLMCLDKSKFCDGYNDCGDGSDEPPGCDSDCSIALETLNPSKLCDGSIDCLGQNDLGHDESVSRCCANNVTTSYYYNKHYSHNNYRCVLGQPRAGYGQGVELSDTCIPRKCVCDWDQNKDTCPQCPAGEDEVDCVSIFSDYGYHYGNPAKPALPTKDAFGRSETHAQGYLYFTAHGRDYLYCASKKVFTEERLRFMGEALCRHEHFDGLVSIKTHRAASRTQIDPSYTLPYQEQEEYQECQLVYIVCKVSIYS